MKHILTLSVLAAALSASSANAALVAHYGFEGNANDSQGSFNGTENGAVTYVTGKFGQAVSLDSGTDFIQTATNNFGITTGDFTMSVWVQRNGAITGDPAFLSNKNWFSGTNPGINFSIKPDGNLDVNTFGTARVDFQDGDTSDLTDATWHNIILVREGTELRYYFDGTQESTTRTIASTADFTGNLNYVFGDDGTTNYNETPGSGQNWTNPLLLDDIAIYDSALNQTEITALQSASAIPEPSSSTLIGLAGLGLILRRRK